MQFQVPQFIEVEDKIFGPLTFKQFLYFLGGAGSAFLLWHFLPFLIAIPLIVAILGAAAALALGQWNGRPFIYSLEAGFYYLIGSKLYIWSHQRKQQKAKEVVEEPTIDPATIIPKLSDSKLHRLAWSLDIQEKLDKAALSKEARAAMQALPPDVDTVLRTVNTPRNALIQ